MRTVWQTLVSALRLLWRTLEQARRFAVNLLFLLLLVLVVSLWLGDRRPQVPKSSALVLEPYGDLVEQLSGDAEDLAALALADQRRPQTLVRPLLMALEYARTDHRIQAVYLDLDQLGGGGLSKLQTVASALEQFRSSGKRVIAVGRYYSQNQYFLAAAADEIYMHPMGMVFLPGYGSYRRYYKETLDKLGIEANVFRVGEYKSAVEPFLRGDMSPQEREARLHWLQQLWGEYSSNVARRRGLAVDTVVDYSERLADLVVEHDGDGAKLAESLGLIDGIRYPDEVEPRMIDLVGKDEEGLSFSRIGYRTYLAAVHEEEAEPEEAVAVVVASGPIYDGTRQAGSVGGDSMARLLRDLREDDSIRAVVLRVDSPGGSSFASEVIRREIDLLRENGKPVVASMSSVAASGGYWISMSSDEIWAAPTTLTGSIGIFALLPTFEQPLAKLGVRNDGVGTGDLAGTLRLDRDLPEAATRAMQALIERGYQDFVEKVAESRNIPVDEIDRMSQGRVWTGFDAERLGLVDHLGELDEAIEAAARRAGIGEAYRVSWVEPERDWRQRFLEQFVGRFEAQWRSATASPWVSLARDPVIRDVVELQDLARLGDPAGLYAYCFCEPN